MPNAEQPAAVTRALAEFAIERDLSGLPEDVLDLVRRSLVDTVGVTIAARDEPAVRILRATLAGAGRSSDVGARPDPANAGSAGELPAGPATVLVDGARTTAPTAALLNGTAGHALDFDDVTDVTYGHPSVVLWPALLAAAEQAGATGRQVAEAFVVGFGVQCAIARGMRIREHYGRGWHSSATVGVIGATAGVARLLGLDVERTRCALGLAASMAGGSRQNFGTMTKPLHVGLAARDAVLAASLAGGGFTADPDQLEQPLGFFAMFGEHRDLAAVLESINGPLALTVHGLNVKKYPCCFNTHRTADATLDLAAREGIKADEVRRVRLTLEPGGFDPLIHHRPTTGLHGKFSAEYVIAAALLDGAVRLSTFTDAAVQRPEAQRLLAKVEYAESATPPVGEAAWDQAYSVVTIETDRGEVTFRTDVPRGDRRAPLGRADLEAKFRDCLAFAGAGWDADDLLAELWAFDSGERFTLDALKPSAGVA